MIYHENLRFKTKLFNSLRRMFKYSFPQSILLAFLKKKSGNGLIKKMVPPEYLFNSKTIKRASRNGISYILDISNVVDHNVYFYLESKGFENFKSLVKEGYNIIDIGANIGSTSIELAKQSKGCKVFAYEPVEETHLKLCHNVELNPYNVTPIRKGIGNEKCEVSISKPVTSNPGMNRILSSFEKSYASEKIIVSTLDSEVEELNLKHVDLIKIDVEGYEMYALLGAKKTLERYKPTILLELVDKNLKEHKFSAMELVNMLRLDYGYKVLDAFSLEEIGTDYDLENIHLDILCIHTK